MQTAAWIAMVVTIAAIGPMGCGERERLTVEIGGERFHLEIADDHDERVRGLMHRDTLAEDGGMLFVFPDMDPRSFWMKSCLIDIDVIFLDGTGRVVRTHTMAAPEPGTPDRKLRRYGSGRPAQFAIELNAGEAERLGVERGDRIKLPLERLKARAR